MEKRRLFGSSGIRGVVGKDVSVDSFHDLARSVGTTLKPSSRVCVATDSRLSKESLKQAVVSGLMASDITVVDLGILPTPALAFLTREMGFESGIMITASHNPPEYNGMKLFNGNSLGYSRKQEETIEKVFFEKSFRKGHCSNVEPDLGSRRSYYDFLRNTFSRRISKRQWKVVVDPGNGAASGLVSEIFADNGLDVLSINDYYDGNFPGRSPEPMEDTLHITVDFLRQHKADLAVCFDGDADRVVFCDQEGFLGFNEMIAFISRLIAIETGKKRIATTVETGSILDLAVADLGVEVVRGKVGDVNVSYLTRDLDAALGVEGIGVYIIPKAGYYPDSIFAAMTLLSRLNDPGEIRDFFTKMPKLFFEKAKVPCPNELKEIVISDLEKTIPHFGATNVNTLDGLRLEFDDSWVLIRASGTEPIIRVIAESQTQPRTKTLLDHGIKAVESCLWRFMK